MSHSGTMIYMSNVPGEPDKRRLLFPLYCEKIDGSPGFVPQDFIWDGSSSEIETKDKSTWKRLLLAPIVGPINFVARGVFPRHRHPIASSRHDWRCRNAKNAAERKWADVEFEKDVAKTSWWITKKVGYVGVRTGAFLGIGNNF